MKKRRDFLKNAGILATGAILLPSISMAFKKVKNVGIQLYTFRKEMLIDPKGTLKIISDLGIKEIESASSNRGLYYGLKPVEMKQICNDLGMKIVSGHCSINATWQDTIRQASESGQEYLIASVMPYRGQTIDSYKRSAERFNKAGEECKAAGLKFGFHNHDVEFEQVDGQILYDILLDNTDPNLVHMELDLGWVVAAGKDPISYFKKYGPRFPLWHLKDMKGKGSTELGKGTLDIKMLLKHGNDSGMKHFFIEQEEYDVSALASMEINMSYLKNLRI